LAARRDELHSIEARLFQPIDFMLAKPLEDPSGLADPMNYLIEDKYDGIRAQVHVGDGRIQIFTRGMEDATASFPELVDALRQVAGSAVLDGEILAWRGDRALPFSELQQRLEAEAHERLEALCQSQLGAQVPYETVVVTGRPVVEIQQLVRQYTVDCLVLGAHSTDKPEHQLFGSTAERLLHHTACPIFMVPPRQASEFISHG